MTQRWSCCGRRLVWALTHAYIFPGSHHVTSAAAAPPRDHHNPPTAPLPPPVTRAVLSLILRIACMSRCQRLVSGLDGPYLIHPEKTIHKNTRFLPRDPLARSAIPELELELELGMLRLPTRSLVPAPVPAPLRVLVPRLFEPGDARFAPVVPAPVPERLAVDGCARGVSPRAVPP